MRYLMTFAALLCLACSADARPRCGGRIFARVFHRHHAPAAPMYAPQTFQGGPARTGRDARARRPRAPAGRAGP